MSTRVTVTVDMHDARPNSYYQAGQSIRWAKTLADGSDPMRSAEHLANALEAAAEELVDKVAKLRGDARIGDAITAYHHRLKEGTP